MSMPNRLSDTMAVRERYKVKTSGPGTYLVYEDGQQPVSGIAVHHYERIDKWRCESHGKVTEAPCWHRSLIEKEEDAT